MEEVERRGVQMVRRMVESDLLYFLRRQKTQESLMDEGGRNIYRHHHHHHQSFNHHGKSTPLVPSIVVSNMHQDIVMMEDFCRRIFELSYLVMIHQFGSRDIYVRW